LDVAYCCDDEVLQEIEPDYPNQLQAQVVDPILG